MIKTAKKTVEAAPIKISEEDYDRIADMAIRMEKSAPDFARLLLDEIDRAKIYPLEGSPPGRRSRLGV